MTTPAGPERPAGEQPLPMSDAAASDPRGAAAPTPPVADLRAAIASGGSSSLADGEWHRLHPLTPLLKGGIVLLIVAGIVISNMRDRIVSWFINTMAPDVGFDEYNEGDPIDWLISNDLILVGSLAALGLIVVFCVVFYVFWRFHTFRITEEHVEVRKGILFRSQRRAPLDRVQGVNLTRPFPARLIGMAKLEVVGAGADANVALEYLSTTLAEEVRADILRLASGARLAKRIARGEVSADTTATARLAGTVTEGLTGLIEGVDHVEEATPESIVKIPAGRLIASQLLSILPWFLIAAAAGVVVTLMPVIFGEGREAAFGAVAAGIGVGISIVVTFAAVTWGLISRSLRYSIAPTSDGVRTTYGLLTTVTETLPPGRVHALEITQPLLWRPFGWWSVRINRLTGASATQQASTSQQMFNTALPVGLIGDVVRVVRLMLPDLPDEDLPIVYHHGLGEPGPGDPYRVMRRGAGWRRPVSWRRHGFALTDYALFLRRGRIWRKVAVFPLARLQGLSIEQGPIDRMQRVGWAQAHVITGPITGTVVGIDREPLLALQSDVSRRAALAAGRDVSHRWAEVLEETRAEQAALRGEAVVAGEAEGPAAEALTSEGPASDPAASDAPASAQEPPA